MRAGDAKQTATDWFHDEWMPGQERSGRAQGCHGAYVMGSLAGRADDDEFDADASDIDVAILVDPEILPPDPERYPHGAFTVYRGCTVQAIFVPTSVLAREETLLGMLGLGCNLLRAHVLSDPDGLIRAATETVIEHWREPQWLVRRTERAVGFARKAVAAMPATTGPVPRLSALCDAAMQLAGILAIADGVPPTHRRALALAEERLRLRGRDDLNVRLLDTIGAAAVGTDDVAAALADALLAVEVETRYVAANLSAELRANLARLVVAGVQELVREGRHGAAMLPALMSVATSAASTAGASAEDGATFDDLATAALRRAGIPPDSWETRCTAIAGLLDELVALTSSP